MKRRNQILAGLLGAQIILIVLIFLPRMLPAQNQSGPLLGNVQASDIVKMTVSDNVSHTITLAKQGNAWTLPDFENYPAKSDQVSQFVDKLIGIKTDVLATNTASSLKRLQVADDDFVRKIDLQGSDGTVHTLYLGTASGGGANHVRLGGQDNVYVARGLNAFEAATDANGWINPTYLSVPQNNILSASIENAQGKFEFSNNANVWSLKNLPSGAQFNQQELLTLLATLGSLNMQSPLGKTAKPEYGLDKPSATVTVVISDANSSKVDILKIGAKDSAGNYPVISSDSTWYVTVPAGSVEPFINAKLDTFLVQPTPTPQGALPAPTETLPMPTSPVTATPIATATITATTPLTPTATPQP
ncbi:MAG TPA: DUF4340 domain-containing protein [Anaerolineae bacterium]|nr:DUF4340 domain-containing protein [Anaerolineae bacterium]